MLSALRGFLRSGLLIFAIVFTVAANCFAANNGGSGDKFVPGEIIITVANGTASGDVQNVAAAANASVVEQIPSLRSTGVDIYRLRLTGDKSADATKNAIASVKNNSIIRYAGYNTIERPFQVAQSTTPNDPRYGSQWALPMINMPKAWSIEKGSASVVVAVVDTGVDIDHPEFTRTRVMTGYNTVTGTSDPRPYPGETHGTHVAGIAVAQGNNGIGITGVAWDNTMLLPINASYGNGGFTADNILKALAFISTAISANPDKKFVVNYSGGSYVTSPTPDLTVPTNAAWNALATQGAVVCISSGNGYDEGNNYSQPSNLAAINKNIISVASVGPAGTHAYYSSAAPYVTVAAPGGDISSGNQADEIISTLPIANGSYGYMQGTSMASPCCAGAVAILLSRPEITVGMIKDGLSITARPVPGATVPSDFYGTGIIDVYAALLKLSTGVHFITPVSSSGDYETKNIDINFSVNQIAPANLTLTLDGDPITLNVNDPALDTNSNLTNITEHIIDTHGNTVFSRYNVQLNNQIMKLGRHTLVVTGLVHGATTDATYTDTVVFSITPHQVGAGLSMVSFPYLQPSAIPENFLGADYLLVRWAPGEANVENGTYGRYFSYPLGNSAFATFAPTDVVPHLDGSSASVAPVGLAYWAATPTNKPVVTTGRALTTSVVIPLIQSRPSSGTTAGTRFISWNMVGDPFPYDVPFSAVLVDTPSGRISVSDAASRGYILPNLYRSDGNGGYVIDTLPNGVLKAWAGHWMGVLSDKPIALVVPPLQVTRSAKSAVVTGDANGWSLKLNASTKSLSDNNIIGQSSRALDKYDINDTPKPPMMSPYVSVGVTHNDWGVVSGSFVKDIQSNSGSKTWNVQVATDQSNSDVTLSWSTLAGNTRGVKLTIKDEATGQVVDMRSRTAVTFKTGDGIQTRNFTITSQPSTGNAVKITGVAVRPSSTRAAGSTNIAFTLTGDASYDVKVLNGRGAAISNVTTRSAAAGNINLVWSGKDNSGRSVPAGTYIVQIRATGTDGDMVKVVQPFMVSR